MLLPVISVCISTIWTKLFPDQVSLPAESSTSAEKSQAGSGSTPGGGPRTGSQSRDQRAPSPPSPRPRTFGGGGPRVKAVELSWTEHLSGSSCFKHHLGPSSLGILKNALDGLSLTVSSCLDPFQIKWPQGGWRGGKLAGL